ncbi:MAG: FRG domain-containing protein [Rhodospirillales bacterium]
MRNCTKRFPITARARAGSSGASQIPRGTLYQKRKTRYREADENTIFDHWKKFSKYYIKEITDDWELLAIAQHYGVPTRLLDWSRNPLVAAFFSLSADAGCDGAIFAVQDCNGLKKVKDTKWSRQSGIGFFEPDSSILRIIRQGGMFTVHGPADKDLSEDSSICMKKFLIKNSAKKVMLKDIERYGVTHMHCFPNLDGVGDH